MCKYSLSDLAWLSSCLFPEDFRCQLVEIGVDKYTSFELSKLVQADGRHRNILEIYQIYRSDDEVTKILDNYCAWWLSLSTNKLEIRKL